MSTLNLRKKFYYFSKEKGTFKILCLISLLEKAYMINYIILMIIQRCSYYGDGNLFLFPFFFRITDLRNIKRRLYLSTVHKEVSSTPLHAKIPLFMIKRKIVSITWIFPKILNSFQQILTLGLLCIWGILLISMVVLKHE